MHDGTALSKLRPTQKPVANMFFGSFSTKVSELQDEGWSDHLLAGEHRPGSGVPAAGVDLGLVVVVLAK